MSSECAIDHQPRPHPHPEHPEGISRSKASKRLRITLGIAVSLVLLEGLGAWMSGSLALMADAVHVFADSFALGVTILAAWLSQRPKTSTATYGYYRLEVLSALFNGVLLLVLAFLIATEAIDRFSQPLPLNSHIMLVVAVIGLVANLLMVIVLKPAHSHNLNIRGAFLHVVSDTLASVAVIVGAVMIQWTSITWIDSVASLFVAIMITSMAIRLVLDSAHVLIESSPKHMNPKEIEQELYDAFSEIHNIHDFHVWEITAHLFAMTAHIEANVKSLNEVQQLIDRINHWIKEKYGIGHTTFQIETHSEEKSEELLLERI